MYEYGFNPYAFVPQPKTPQIATQSELIRVTGLEGAKAYQMNPNSVVALFDSGEDIFYVKSTDGAGFPTIRGFRFSPLEMQEPVVNGEFVTRKEFEMLRQEVLNYGKQLVPTDGQKPDTTAE